MPNLTDVLETEDKETVEGIVEDMLDIPNVAFTNVNNVYTVAQTGDREVVAYASVVYLDFASSNRFDLTLTGNITIGYTGLLENQGGVIYVGNSGAGAYTITWGSAFKQMNVAPADVPVGDIQVFSYEVYSASKIILSYVGTI